MPCVNKINNGNKFGNRYKVIRKRFDEELIELILELKWWDKSTEEIKNLIPILTDNNIEKVKNEIHILLKN